MEAIGGGGRAAGRKFLGRYARVLRLTTTLTLEISRGPMY